MMAVNTLTVFLNVCFLLHILDRICEQLFIGFAFVHGKCDDASKRYRAGIAWDPTIPHPSYGRFRTVLGFGIELKENLLGVAYQ
jgi:hypothetical protein